MVTDGEPTAHFEPGAAEPYFEYPPVPATVDATLREVNRCTRDGIRINTFMLDATSYLRHFVETLTQAERRPGLLHDERRPRRLRAPRLRRAPARTMRTAASAERLRRAARS